MNAAAGDAPAASNTAYPAQWSRNSKRRVVTALVELGIEPRVARAAVSDRVALGETPAQIEAYLRATFHLDPTAVRAIVNVEGWRE
jgi:hypothetical protein